MVSGGLAVLPNPPSPFCPCWSTLPSQTPRHHWLSPFPVLDTHVRSAPAAGVTNPPRNERQPFFFFHGHLQVKKHIVLQCSAPEPVLSRQSGEDMLHAFLGGMGFAEEETNSILELNPALTLANFESIRTRVSDLRSAGIDGIHLCPLITKYPNVLVAKELEPFLQFVVKELPGKLEPRKLRAVLATGEPRYFVGLDKKVRLLLDHGVPRDKIVRVLNNASLIKAFCTKSLQEVDRTLTFFGRFGGIELVVRRPLVLNFDLDAQLIPKVEYLKKISGGDEAATGALLRKLPAILSYSLEHTTAQVELLTSVAGLSRQQIFTIFLVFPNLISASRERKLLPRIELLQQCGFSSDEIFKYLRSYPLFIGLSYGTNLVHKIVFLVKIGYRHGTREFMFALGSVTRTSCENLQSVIGLYLGYGLSCEDILSMTRKHPQILQYSYDSSREKIAYLVEEMGRDVRELLAFPAFLGYSLDARIKVRYEKRKKVLGKDLSIIRLLSVSAATFPRQGKKGRNPIPD